MLPLPTIRKLFAESFPEQALKEQGIMVIKKADRQQQLLSLLDRYQDDEDVDGKVWEYGRGKQKDSVLGLVIYSPSGGKNGFDYFKVFYIETAKKYGLWIMDAKKRRSNSKDLPPFPICSIDQLDHFIAAIKQRQNESHLKEKRKDKVAQLRQTGLLARLKQLGSECNFSFAMGQSKREVNLSVRVKGRKRGFHFSFPKGKLEAVLDQLPELIETLQRMQKLGVHFRADNKTWKGKQGDWIEPSPSSDGDE